MFGLSDLVHTSLIVNDMATARRSLSAAYGCEWSEPTHYTAPVRTPAGVVDQDSITCFSLDNSHRLELLQPVYGGIWPQDDDRPRLHHLAFQVDDLELESARLEALGMPVVLTGIGDAPVAGFVFHGGPGSLFTELTVSHRTSLASESSQIPRRDLGPIHLRAFHRAGRGQHRNLSTDRTS